MKIIPYFLILLLLSVSISAGIAREQPELPQYLSSAKLQGSGRLTWWGFHIYDASFYRLGSLGSPEFALDLRYQKAFSGKSIANRSVEEMKLAGVPEDQANVWGKELIAFMPNVEPGNSLSAIYSPKQGTSFYYDGKQIAQIPGADFSKAFFGIWLDSKTSAPKLRTELLGQTCPPPLFNEAC